MTDTPDAELLEQFQKGSEGAFTILVERYVALVHSVARRHTANPRDAQDITQAVFIVLTRKAGTLGRKTVLPGWLYRTARLTAANFQRAEMRRIHREQEAYMQSTLEEPMTDILWRELAPQLDEAMACLGASERDALVLRYFQNKSVAEVGTFLGVRENAAQQRVMRALEKLRKFLMKRGVASTAAVIAGAISANSVQAAPVGMAQIISAGAVAKGAAVSTSTLTLVRGALKIMAWTKTQTAIVAGVGALLAVTATTSVVVVKYNEARNAWDVWPGDFAAFDATLKHSPPQVRIVPTKFSDRHGASNCGGAGGKMMGFDVTIADMAKVAYASPGEYNWDTARTIVSSDVPQGQYDFIANLRDDSWLALQKEMERKFGVVGKRETRNEDCLLLTVRKPHAPGLVHGDPDKGRHSDTLQDGETSFVNYQMSDLAVDLQRDLNVPVVDGTGLAGSFNFIMNWDDKHPSALKQSLLDKAGLELVPTNMPVEMLVVERGK